MSDKKELRDEELNKVSGGFGCTINSLNIGDCFSYRAANYGSIFLMCRKNYPEVNEDTVIEFDYYDNAINDAGYRGIQKSTAKSVASGIYGYDHYYSNPNYIPRN